VVDLERCKPEIGFLLHGYLRGQDWKAWWADPSRLRPACGSTNEVIFAIQIRTQNRGTVPLVQRPEGGEGMVRRPFKFRAGAVRADVHAGSTDRADTQAPGLNAVGRARGDNDGCLRYDGLSQTRNRGFVRSG